MLRQLSISNFAIIENVEIELDKGFTVITGETGTGKSVILDALDFLLGARANTDLVKTGKEKAKVEGTFTFESKNFFEVKNYLKENEFDCDENSAMLTISRELTLQGSKARINGSIANTTQLLKLRKILLDLHAQNEHIELLKPEKQISVLDDFGDDKHKKLLESYGEKYLEYITLKESLSKNTEDFEEQTKKIKNLEYEINEIKEAKITDLEEEEKLKIKREITLNKKELEENTAFIYAELEGKEEESLISKLLQIKKLTSKCKEHDDSFEPYLKHLEEGIENLKDFLSFARSYNENLSEKENNLAVIEERLNIFYKLKKKHGGVLEEVLNKLKEFENELKNLKLVNISKDKLEEKFNSVQNEINIIGDKLTKSREQITKDFVEKINAELLSLGFKNVVFAISFNAIKLNSYGKEQIEFLFSSNPDEPPKPIVKVASGGELSRIMLAIKATACTKKENEYNFNNPKLTMIFDEIDIGVSGEIASSVGKKLSNISKSTQVLCITHEPIIACMANEHFLVEKEVCEGITRVQVRKLSKDEREDAIVSLLAPENKAQGNAKLFVKSLMSS